MVALTREPVRVMLVDDHPVFREGLGNVLGQTDGFAVVGEAASAVDAMRMLRSREIDLAVVDVTLGAGSSGLTLTKQIVAEWPDLRVLLLSMHDERSYGVRAFGAGAHGYVQKDRPLRELLGHLETVMGGRLAFSESVQAQLRDEQQRDEGGVAQLTDRELEVFQLVGVGRRIRDVAQDLHISRKTVESHVASIKKKLAIRHSNELVYRATLWVSERDRGLV